MRLCALTCACAWQQASETPFGAEAVQDGAGSQDGHGDQHSTIHEAAQDIANNWGKAPQPRRVAQRHKQMQQGVLASPLLLSTMHRTQVTHTVLKMLWVYIYHALCCLDCQCLIKS